MKLLSYKVWAGVAVLWFAAFSASSHAQDWGAFGGAIGPDPNSAFVFPTGAESFAGWAWTGADIYPLAFPDGGEITFTAQADTPTNVSFRFERLPFPDFDPAFNTAEVTVSTDGCYSVTIPPRPSSETYSSFILYLTERDQFVRIENVTVTPGGSGGCSSGGTGPSGPGESVGIPTLPIWALFGLVGILGVFGSRKLAKRG